MIKYPVRVEFIKGYGTFILDSEGRDILQYLDSDKANSIANALNAVNEFPKPLHEEPDKITFGIRLFNWYDKYINPRPKENLT